MNTEQFKHIYYPFHQKLYRIAFRLLGDIHSAEDMVQDVYLKLWDKRHGLGNVEHPEAFAVMVIRNLCLNQLREKKDAVVVGYDYYMVGTASLSDEIELTDEGNYLKQLIEKLPEAQRQIIILRDYEGYSYEEIAGIMKMDIKYIRVIVSRTRKILREQFEKVQKV